MAAATVWRIGTIWGEQGRERMDGEGILTGICAKKKRYFGFIFMNLGLYSRFGFLFGRNFVLRILKAQPEDLGVILALQYRAFRSEAKLLGNEGIAPLTQNLADLEQEYAHGTILKAVDEAGVIIGSVRAHEDGDTLYIGKLMVLPEKQGRGIGTQLLVAIEKSCPKSRYELFTSNISIRNMNLYEGLGYRRFREEQVTPELRFVYMEKLAKTGA